MYLLDFAYPASLSCVSHFINICTLAVETIRNMQAVSANQIADILGFNILVFIAQMSRYGKFTAMHKLILIAS